MFGFEWIVAWLLFLASLRVVKTVAVDAWAEVNGRPAPSLVERERRAELAQQQALTTGAPGVGQAIADRLAQRIANPPPCSPWITEALGYIALLLADAFAYLRRRHVEKERKRRGEQPRSGRPGDPYCRACEFNHVSRKGDLCPTCTPVVLQLCPGCDRHVPAAELQRHQRCATCRRPPRDPSRQSAGGDRPGPTRLVIPG